MFASELSISRQDQISTITAAKMVPVMNSAEAPIGDMVLGSATYKRVKANEDKSKLGRQDKRVYFLTNNLETQ